MKKHIIPRFHHKWADSLRGRVMVLAAIGAASVLLAAVHFCRELMLDEPKVAGAARVRIAVLGDSDSHAYQDAVMLGNSNSLRGGRFRATTLQWTEALDRMRGAEIDMGPWGTWGTRIKIAEALEFLGIGGRAPQKQDFRYNFAVTGARCADLHVGHYRQVPRLLREIRRHRAAWTDAIVVIRIGINDLGTTRFLDGLAAQPTEPDALGAIDSCSVAIDAAVQQLVQEVPTIRVVLVGILDNADWPPHIERWRSAAEIASIRAGLDRFDAALQRIAEQDPGRRAFFDDRQWFRSRWGERDSQGGPQYRPLVLGSRLTVEHGQGDVPTKSVLADGHAGAAWNALWARSMVEFLNSEFRTSITPITMLDVLALVDSDRRLGDGAQSPTGPRK